MHPELTAGYSAARAQELRRGFTTDVTTPRAHWRVRRKHRDRRRTGRVVRRVFPARPHLTVGRTQ